ncbi:ABC transporter permease/substrate-binding protein [Streptococcus loxodontisalivarius]|uniref:Osmoprotectant transport system permease protein n=1 Tax=Streptococcus loxodontisalivarius TaxID=1349415 RepID=A0ABS2PVA1_9STRE|nr:ABC transporter permease/substrate-binding protein [Streptococcus loxodontisalivarius]MBM7643645.1 osmoprotectant transport system permease protein [Streptococcus loxodontisalivarius]
MANLMSTFQDRYDEWLTALVEHLQLSLIALLVAMLIAIPLAILVSRHKRLSEISLQITGIFQTIPSLALLGLFIPIMGIGTLPAVVALIVYALFPIMQATVTGLKSLDPSLKEAAEAFGMTSWEKLKTFELPLALPIIMSGIRTSAVMIIGTATLASLIGAGGLGSFITLGIDRNNSSLILIGAISSALLAVFFNAVLKYLEKASFKKILAVLIVALLGLFMSYAPAIIKSVTKEKEAETIVIAGKLGAEPDILINMYKDLIEDQTDLKVELKENFGKTSFLYEALKSGDIDIYPEFTGTITSSLLTNPPTVSNDPEQVYEAARDGIKEQDNLVLLKPMAYQNTYAIVVPQTIAKEFDLETISDLSKVQDKLKAGFTLEFKDREDGYRGMQTTYGLNLDVSTMEPSLRYQAMSTGTIQITDGYSTDSEITQYNLTILEDDKGLFPPYQGAPLMKAELLEKHPELKTVLNQLAGKITESEMSQMNYAVDVEGKSASDVAHDYLVKEGLLDK